MQNFIENFNGRPLLPKETWGYTHGVLTKFSTKIIINGKEVDSKNFINFEQIVTDSLGKYKVIKIDLPATLQAAGAEVGDTVRIIADQEYRFCLTPDGLQKWTPALAKRYTNYTERAPIVYVNAVCHGKRQ